MFEDDGKHAESVIGVDIRLLEPSGRGSLRGRGRWRVWEGCGVNGYSLQKSSKSNKKNINKSLKKCIDFFY